MLFKQLKEFLKEFIVKKRLFFLSMAWLIFISFAHFHVNGDREDRTIIKMGYMPVITNLAAPLLDKASKENESVYFQAVKFSSFSEMGEALRNDSIDVAFMIAPLAIVLRQQGEDVKVVYIGNRHESSLVVRNDPEINSVSDLSGKTIAVPLKFSGHYLLLKSLKEKYGLYNAPKIVEVNPPDMPAAMISGSLDAYFVGEPFASSTLVNQDSKLLFHVEEEQKNFICNLMLIKQDLIKKEPGLVKLLVESAARSGIWAGQNKEKAATIASEYWNQPVELIFHALAADTNRVVFNRFTPVETELKQMARKMRSLNMLKTDSIEGLIDDRFASKAILEDIEGFETIMRL